MRKNDNPPAFVIDHSPTDFYITASSDFFKKPTTIHIDRQTGKIRQYPAGASPLNNSPKSNIKSKQFCLVLGIISIKGQPFLAIVTEADMVCEIIKHPVYVVKRTMFMAFRYPYDSTVLGYNDTVKMLDSIQDNLLKDNFYFSYDYDLTLSQQKQSRGKHVQSCFFWNQRMLSRFFGIGLQKYWHIPVIQGLVFHQSHENDYFVYQYIMISRRSYEMGGTRFHSRGIDTHGNAANFVETEELLICHNYLLSYVHVRGSLPIFWSQSGFGAAPFFPQNLSNSLNTPKHYRILEEAYQGQIVTVNLLSASQSSNQVQLTNKFESVFQNLPHKSREHYIKYDLNKQIQGKDDVQYIIERFLAANNKVLLRTNNFTAIDFYRGKVLQDQKVYIRTNCLDCLDRTNVLQFKISQIIIREFQDFINRANNGQQEKSLTFDKTFLTGHREAWLCNGDRISMIYSGTPSVSSYITKGDKNKNFFSIINSTMKSINRFYNAQVSDDSKQQGLNYLLVQGQDSRTFFFQDNISRRLPQLQFNTFNEIGLCIFSWNCAQLNPANVNLQKLFSLERESVSIIVVCLQEMVELNTYNVLLGANKTTQQMWRERLNLHFRQKMNKNFVYLVESDLVGIFTMMFVLEEDRNRVTQLNWSEIKTGFKGNLGNKGCVALSFFFDDTPISILNCHMEAGEGKVDQRIYSIESVHHNAFPERFKRRQFENSEFCFLVGDLNFRIDMPYDTVRNMIIENEKRQSHDPLVSSSELVLKLLQRDELGLVRKKNSILSRYQQKQITFMPTYKYVKGTNTYDWKSKKIPSWCDRILFSADRKKIIPTLYKRIEMTESDHKPIISHFEILTRREDKAKKRKLYEQFMAS